MELQERIENEPAKKPLKYYNDGKPISQEEYDKLKDNKELDEDMIYKVNLSLEDRIEILEKKVNKLEHRN